VVSAEPRRRGDSPGHADDPVDVFGPAVLLPILVGDVLLESGRITLSGRPLQGAGEGLFDLRGGLAELLFGEPFDEAVNLPDYVVDREDENDNPGNERFFEAEAEENSPELDDDNYTPEVTLRPKFPEPRLYSTHNLTVGLSLFRNRALATAADPESQDVDDNDYTTYQGYTIRYAYTFRTHYWLRSRAAALLSLEGMFGVYNFNHTFPDSRVAQVRVIPLGANMRYMVEVSKLFRLYPYVGYQYFVVSAVNGTLDQLEPIKGGRLFGGAGAQLVMSNAIDARLEAGSDGIMGGIVVKF
jgi:hypothetical protein